MKTHEQELQISIATLKQSVSDHKKQIEAMTRDHEACLTHKTNEFLTSEEKTAERFERLSTRFNNVLKQKDEAHAAMQSMTSEIEAYAISNHELESRFQAEQRRRLLIAQRVVYRVRHFHLAMAFDMFEHAAVKQKAHREMILEISSTIIDEGILKAIAICGKFLQHGQKADIESNENDGELLKIVTQSIQERNSLRTRGQELATSKSSLRSPSTHDDFLRRWATLPEETARAVQNYCQIERDRRSFMTASTKNPENKVSEAADHLHLPFREQWEHETLTKKANNNGSPNRSDFQRRQSEFLLATSPAWSMQDISGLDWLKHAQGSHASTSQRSSCRDLLFPSSPHVPTQQWL